MREHALKERISGIILLQTANKSLVDFAVDNIISNEKSYMERFVRNELVKVQNKAKIKSYEDLGITSYIIKEDDDEKICEECSIQNKKIYLITEFEIRKTGSPFHINCRGTIEPKIEKEVKEKIENDFTSPNSKEDNGHTENEKLFSHWSEVEPETEETAESQELNRSKDTTTPNVYIEYIKNRVLASDGDALELKRKYSMTFPALDDIMLYVTPVEKGESDTLDNLNNKSYQDAYKRYLKRAESENRSPVNYNTFLNTVLPVIDKIKRNREEVNANTFEHFINADTTDAKEASEYSDIISGVGEPVFMLVKKIFDKIFFSVPSLANSWENSLIEDILEKDGLLDEDDSKGINISEILDIAANAAAEAVNDSLDFVNIDGKASSISKNLYSSAKKEAKEAVEKEIADEAKDTVSKVGKQVLKNKTIETVEDVLKEKNVKSIDDILKGLKDITTNKRKSPKNLKSSGGYEQAMKDFESLNPINVKDIETEYGSGKVGFLSDGTKIVIRKGSKSDGATMEVIASIKIKYKIRY